MQPFDCTVRLRVISFSLLVQNVEHFAKLKPKIGSKLRPTIRGDRFRHSTVEASKTRGTTALVYLQLHSSLYTGTVHVLSSVAGVHPAGLTADQGCRQVSTNV